MATPRAVAAKTTVRPPIASARERSRSAVDTHALPVTRARPSTASRPEPHLTTEYTSTSRNAAVYGSPRS